MRLFFVHPGLLALSAALLLHSLPSLPATSTLCIGFLALALCGLLIAKRARVIWWLCVGIAGVLLRAHAALDDRLPIERTQGYQTVSLRVEGLPRRGDEGWSFQARWIEHPKLALLDVFWSAGYGASAGANLPLHLMAGDELRAEIKLRSLGSPRNSMAWGWADPELRALERGVTARASVKSAVKLAGNNPPSVDKARYLIRERIFRLLAQDHARASGILVGLVLGDQGAISTNDWEFFNRTGVGHLMSISGLHVTMFAFAGSAFAVFCLRSLLRWRKVGQSWGVRALMARTSTAMIGAWIGLAFAAGYCLFSGAEIPAQRTVWMLLAMAVSRSCLRHTHPLTPIGMALLVVLAIDPWAVASPGFWLSFVATTVLFQLANTSHWWLSAIKAQWMVTLGLLPLSALLFGAFAPLSLVANMLAIPTVSYLITPFAMLGSMCSLSSLDSLAVLGSLLLKAAAWVSETLVTSLHFVELASPSWAQMQPLAAPGTWVGFLAILAGALCVLWVAFGSRFKHRPILSAAVMLVGLAPIFALPHVYAPITKGLHVTAFDLGNASSILVETPDVRLLYDAGAQSSTGRDSAKQAIIPWLSQRGIRRLDYLVVSHADREHAGGVSSLQKALAVGTFVQPNCTRESRTIGNTRLEFYGIQAQVSPGRQPRAPTSRESAHCVMSVHWGEDPGASILLLGDLSQKGQTQWLKHREEAKTIGILQMPGQGSAKTWAPGFLESLSPKYVLSQLRANHWRAYPVPKVLEAIDAHGATLLRTDTMGAVQLRVTQGVSKLEAAIYRERLDRPRYFD